MVGWRLPLIVCRLRAKQRLPSCYAHGWKLLEDPPHWHTTIFWDKLIFRPLKEGTFFVWPGFVVFFCAWSWIWISGWCTDCIILWHLLCHDIAMILTYVPVRHQPFSSKLLVKVHKPDSCDKGSPLLCMFSQNRVIPRGGRLTFAWSRVDRQDWYI